MAAWTDARAGFCRRFCYIISVGESLRISIADDNKATARLLEKLLTAMGHRVASVAHSGRDLVSQVLGLDPPASLIITDALMPELGGIEAIGRIWTQGRPTAAIIVSGHEEFKTHEAAGYYPEFLLKGSGKDELAKRIELALEKFAKHRAICEERDRAQRRLEERTQIDRAKGSIIARVGVGEPEAHSRLQRLASAMRSDKAEAARWVLAVEKVLTPESL